MRAYRGWCYADDEMDLLQDELRNMDFIGAHPAWFDGFYGAYDYAVIRVMDEVYMHQHSHEYMVYYLPLDVCYTPGVFGVRSHPDYPASGSASPSTDASLADISLMSGIVVILLLLGRIAGKQA